MNGEGIYGQKPSNIGCPQKNCLLAFSVFSKLPRMKIFLAVEITDKEPSLRKFRRNLVDVKIRHLIGRISYVNQNKIISLALSRLFRIEILSVISTNKKDFYSG